MDGEGQVPPDKRPRVPGSIQSVEAALVLLRTMAEMDGPASLSDLARRCGMPASKVHRYLATFINAGLVTQRHRSGHYDLGRGALDIGLAAMARNPLVNAAGARLEEIVEATGAAALLAVWGNHGPTVVRWERNQSFVITSLGLGTTLPLLNSATGHVYLAWGPTRWVEPLLANELERASSFGLRWPTLEPTRESVRTLADKVRRQGYAAVGGEFIPGLNGISGPILNWQGEAEACLTITSGDPHLLDPNERVIPLLKRICGELSTGQLRGASGPTGVR